MAVHKIIAQDLSDETSEPIVIVEGDFLNFSKNHLITGVNTIEDLLFWVDNYNQPRKINTDVAIQDPTYYDNEDKISVAKVAPYKAPFIYEHENLSSVSIARTIGRKDDGGLGADVQSDYLKDKFVRFSYRYKFEDNEYSLMAPFSQIVFEPLNNGAIASDNGNTNADPNRYGIENIIDTTRVEIMQNIINRVKLRIPLPDENDRLTAQSNTLSTDFLTPSSTISINGASIQPGTYIVKGGDSSAKSEGITQFHTDTLVTTPATGLQLRSGKISGSSGDKINFVPMWQNKFGIKSIEILIKESDDQAVRVVGEIPVTDTRDFTSIVDVYPFKTNSGALTLPLWRYCCVFDFKAERPYKSLTEQEMTRISDDVPRIAQAQEVVSNRVVYGNYLKDYEYPLDGSGNKGINYYVSEKIKGDLEYDTINAEEEDWGNLQHNEHAHRYSSVKQRRTYQVGIVLSDRWGRKSPVILSSIKNKGSIYDASDTITIENDSGLTSEASPVNYSVGGPSGGFSWSANVDDIIGRCLSITFNEQRILPASQCYHPTDNIFGWYSYKIVVKQSQQEYNNVYVSHPLTLIADDPASPSYISLFSDNINKVPRSILEQDATKNYVSGSDILLFPKVVQTATDNSTASRMSTSPMLIDVVSIGTQSDFDYNNTGALDNFIYKQEKGPLLGEILNLTVYQGVGHDTIAPIVDVKQGLTVFETEPFDSKLDIYYETSTTGLISDLNYILAALPPLSIPIDVQWDNVSGRVHEAAESYTGALADPVEATKGNPSNTLEYELLHLYDYNGGQKVDYKNAITLNSSTGVVTIKSDGPGFCFRNNGYDEYEMVVKVSEYTPAGEFTGSSIEPLILKITNSIPTISLYRDLYPASGAETGSSSTGLISFFATDNEPVIILNSNNVKYNYNGLYSNGGRRTSEKYQYVEFEVTFPDAPPEAREFLEDSFKIQEINGYFNLVATDVWAKTTKEQNDEYGVNKRYVLEDLIDLERTALIKIIDNGSLDASVYLTIKERNTPVKMPSIYNWPFRSSFITSDNKTPTTVNQVNDYYNKTTNPSPNVTDWNYPGSLSINSSPFANYETGWLGRGSRVEQADPSNPKVGNILYSDINGNKLWTEDPLHWNWIDGTGEINQVIIYKYTNTKNSSGENVAEYRYMVIDKVTSEVTAVGVETVFDGQSASQELGYRLALQTFPPLIDPGQI